MHKETFTMALTRWLRNLEAVWHLTAFRLGSEAVPQRPAGRRRRPARSAAHSRPRLEALEDRCLPSTFFVTNTGDNNGVNPAPFAGTGTLRQALVDSNATPGTNTIDFNIPGTGVQKIQAAAELPVITNPVVIDATSQPGYAGSPLIDLDGTVPIAAGPASALNVYAGGAGSTIKGLAIDNWSSGINLLAPNNTVVSNYIGVAPDGNTVTTLGYGIDIAGPAISGATSSNNLIEGNVIAGGDSANLFIQGSSSNTVIGNFLGTNAAGTAALGGRIGVWFLDSPAQNNTIGGSAAADRNVISGNSIDGVDLDGTDGPIDNNVVQGNYIGTDVTGTKAVPNLQDGVAVTRGSSNNLIGGSTPGAGNLISGNSGNGVNILSDGFAGTGVSNQNAVEGNLIGTDATGSNPLGNGADGVRIGKSTNNAIGGTYSPLAVPTGVANTIDFNASGGVLVTGATAVGNSLRANSVFENQTLGIDLDRGGNNSEKSPALASAVALSGGTTRVAGTLHSLANTSFDLDFYASPPRQGAVPDQGQTYLGAATVTTDKNGVGHFTVVLPVATTPGNILTATATDPAGNTSEFSKGQVITSGTAAGSQSLAATGTSNSVTVNPGAATHFGIAGPASVTAGSAFSLTVTALDQFNNVATGYGGTVGFASSDSSARLPGNYTYTASDQGVHTFTRLVLKKKGWQTITMTDASNSTILGTFSIDIDVL
jgi:hypothetical protein